MFRASLSQTSQLPLQPTTAPLNQLPRVFILSEGTRLDTNLGTYTRKTLTMMDIILSLSFSFTTSKL